MTPALVARLAASAVGFATHELDGALSDAAAEKVDPRLIDLDREIRHARTHLALAARKAAEILSAPNVVET